MSMVQDRPKESLHSHMVHLSHRSHRRKPLIILALLLLVLTAIGASLGLAFLHNENASQYPHHWVSFHLIGTGRSNFAAIGARVTITAGDKSWVEWVQSPRGDVSHSNHPLTFDVGHLTHIDTVEILWPDERVERVARISIDTAYLMKEGGAIQ